MIGFCYTIKSIVVVFLLISVDIQGRELCQAERDDCQLVPFLFDISILEKGRYE